MIDRRIRIALLVVLAAGLVYLAYLVRAAIVPFILAVVFAFLVEPPIRFLESRGLGRFWAILLVYVVAGLLVAGLLVRLVPILVRQLTALADALPVFGTSVERFLLEIQARYSAAGLPAQIRQVLDGAVARAQADLLGLIQAAISGLIGAVGALATMLLAPFLAFYLLRDRDVIRRRLLQLIPVSTRDDSLRALSEINGVVAGYIRGQLLVSIIVGSLVGLGLSLLGLPFSAILGVVAGVTNVIPYFGPIIGAVPAVAVALLRGPALALETVAVLFLVQQIDSIFITPRIVGVSVGLHPLVVIFSLLAGAELFGVLGMLVAVPLVAVAKVFLKHLSRGLAPRLGRVERGD